MKSQARLLLSRMMSKDGLPGVVAFLIGGILLLAAMSVGVDVRIEEKVLTPTPDYMDSDLAYCLMEFNPISGQPSRTDLSKFVVLGPPTIIEPTGEIANDPYAETSKYYAVSHEWLPAGVVEVHWNLYTEQYPGCVLPSEWFGIYGTPYVAPTPYLLPEEIANGGTPVS